jgi:hypothetical protein
VTALADLNRADRRRVLERLDRLGDLAALMREPGGLPEAPEPEPLHRSHGKTKFSATNETKFSANLVTESTSSSVTTERATGS